MFGSWVISTVETSAFLSIGRQYTLNILDWSDFPLFFYGNVFQTYSEVIIINSITIVFYTTAATQHVDYVSALQ